MSPDVLLRMSRAELLLLYGLKVADVFSLLVITGRSSPLLPPSGQVWYLLEQIYPTCAAHCGPLPVGGDTGTGTRCWTEKWQNQATGTFDGCTNPWAQLGITVDYSTVGVIVLLVLNRNSTKEMMKYLHVEFTCSPSFCWGFTNSLVCPFWAPVDDIEKKTHSNQS